jgi:hypothetical protein
MPGASGPGMRSMCSRTLMVGGNAGPLPPQEVFLAHGLTESLLVGF